jgi:RimJ/RimL family protein N-acetyltransferase
MDFPLQKTATDGQVYQLRAAREEDAQRLLAHLDVIGPELNLKPGDLTVTLEQEKSLLKQYEESENSLFLIAECEGLVIGSLTLYGGRRWANSHVGQLGVSVKPEWRGRGIGHTLLETAIAWAEEGGAVKRLEILSYQTNARARKLYLKLGFVIEGCKAAAVMRDGDYIDVYQMALLLGDAAAHHERVLAEQVYVTLSAEADLIWAVGLADVIARAGLSRTEALAAVQALKEGGQPHLPVSDRQHGEQLLLALEEHGVSGQLATEMTP